MSTEIPVEKKFRVLCEINRAAHFQWLRTVVGMFPEVDKLELVKRYWREVGVETGKAYLKHIDPNRPLPAQFARSFAFSSRCMGEDCVVVPGESEKECYARHDACPWFEWHRREGVEELDLPGCEEWLAAAVEEVNDALGTRLRVETLKSIPAGDGVCLRRFRVD